MNQSMKRIGIIISVVSLLLILGFTYGIQADVGKGNFAYIQLTLIGCFIAMIYASKTGNRNLLILIVVLSITFCAICLTYVNLADKPLYSELESVYQNISSLVFGYVGFNIGLLMQLLRSNEKIIVNEKVST
ncbi:MULTISPECIES: hypothetical protein [unclassified Breznakia]|uniref:hypothetical protein n=1 Tax=unclassified Breznakia TaxID=2623764 RepID=UPI0024749AB7|nr:MULTISPECIES: hypothetical protein [unclassified Breznakia]MDH6367269.1 hypothetical protein [Breznakia sp. PH1-1]MDH6404448.1 hypothetical protein [Breznakia sp. PF1-11]MDH6412161.1 hypothetical protein [Breznakia sp. PFB1-11]MDH6414436.1 hypothetical protein [Breznakia sp. PFB1-14]MDH6416821.1 hypothetical protein [Breznakia sp. PFB1-4]